MRGGLDDKNKCTLINSLTGELDKKIESINNEIERINNYLTSEVATKGLLIDYVRKEELLNILNNYLLKSELMDVAYTIINPGYKSYNAGETKYKNISDTGNDVVQGTQYGTTLLTWLNFDDYKDKIINMQPILFNSTGAVNHNIYNVGDFTVRLELVSQGAAGPVLKAAMTNNSETNYNVTAEGYGTPAILVLLHK